MHFLIVKCCILYAKVLLFALKILIILCIAMHKSVKRVTKLVNCDLTAQTLYVQNFIN